MDIRIPFLNRGTKRRIQKGLLTDVDVELISLLFDDMKPANRKGYVAKCEGKELQNTGSSAKFQIVKSEKEGRIYVTVMEPDVKDAEGDFYTAAEIEKAQERFAKKGMIRKNDVNHNMVAVDEFFVAQSYILKTADEAHYPGVKPGSWVAVIKCEDLSSELWKKVDEGKFNGVSIFGKAQDMDNLDLDELRGRVKALEDQLAAKDPDPAAAAEDKQKSENDGKERKALQKQIVDLEKKINKAVSKQIAGDPDGGKMEDLSVTMANGEKLVVKASHKPLYKAINAVYAGEPMQIFTAENMKLFLDTMLTIPDSVLSELSMLPINKYGKVDIGLVADMVLYNSADERTAQAVGTSDMTVSAQVVTADVTLSKTTLEFYKLNYGEDAFAAYIENAIAVKLKKAISKLVFAGDRSSGTPALKAMDGILEIAEDASAITELEVGDLTTLNYGDIFAAILKDLDEDVTERKEDFRFYLSRDNYINLQVAMANRRTELGDRFTMTGGDIFFLGYAVKPRYLNSNTHIVAGLPKYIVVGYVNDIEMKIEHHGSDYKYHFYPRGNFAINYVPGMVKVYNIVEAS